MLVNYKVKKDQIDRLCDLFHKALTDAELISGVAELRLGNFLIKHLITTANAYAIYHNGRFLMCIKDVAPHSFQMSVHENSYMTINMCKIVLDCLYAAFENEKSIMPKFDTTKEKAVDLIRDVITHSS